MKTKRETDASRGLVLRRDRQRIEARRLRRLAPTYSYTWKYEPGNLVPKETLNGNPVVEYKLYSDWDCKKLVATRKPGEEWKFLNSAVNSPVSDLS